MKNLAGSLKLDLAQYREVADFVKFGSELDEATTILINKGVRLTEVLKQDKYKPMNVLHQVFVIGLGVFDYYEHVAPEEVSVFQEGFLFIFENLDIFKPFNTTLYAAIDPKVCLKILNLYVLGYSKTFNTFISKDFRSTSNAYFA